MSRLLGRMPFLRDFRLVLLGCVRGPQQLQPTMDRMQAMMGRNGKQMKGVLINRERVGRLLPPPASAVLGGFYDDPGRVEFGTNRVRAGEVPRLARLFHLGNLAVDVRIR